MASALLTSATWVAQSNSAFSSARFETVPSAARVRARSSSPLANFNCARVCSSRAPACACASSAAWAAASASALLRVSRKDGSAGSITASMVLPAITGSPDSASMRNTRPETGAEILYISLTLVWPSPST